MSTKLSRSCPEAALLLAVGVRVEDELGAYRAKVAAALVRGAITTGPGQAAMQRIFWQRLGELVEKQERTGADGGPIITKIERVIIDPRNNSGEGRPVT